MPTPPLSNPAQRLLDLLEAHAVAMASHASSGYNAVWAQVFDVPTSEVTLLVSGAFGLVYQIEAAVAVTGDERIRRLVRRYRDEWANAFVPPTSGRNRVVEVGPSEDSLLALGSVASHLRDNLPGGRIPDAEAARTVAEEVAGLIADLRDDDALPTPLRTILIARLHDISWALDHIEIGGADALQAALERLLLAYSARGVWEGNAEPDEHRETVWARVRKVAGDVNDLVSAPGAWFGTVELVLGAGPAIEATLRSLGR